MTNYEKIKNMSVDEMAEFICEIRSSCLIGCAGCKDDELCIERRKEWLKQEAKPTLSEAEHIILKNINKYYRWIARDKDGSLYLFDKKPTKSDDDWFGGSLKNLEMFEHLFQFITWDDDEPYNIAELLEERNEKE